MLPAVIARGGSAVAKWALTTPSGVAITTLTADSLFDAAWDWTFGSEADKVNQENLVREMIDVRSKLSDPTTSPDQMQALAERNNQIQSELEALGINIQEDLGMAQTPQQRTEYTPVITSDTPIDPDGDGEYTLQDIDRATSALRRLSNYLGIQQRNLPALLSDMKVLMQMSEEQMKIFIRLNRGG
jgi:hypothetical protein